MNDSLPFPVCGSLIFYLLVWNSLAAERFTQTPQQWKEHLVMWADSLCVAASWDLVVDDKLPLKQAPCLSDHLLSRGHHDPSALTRRTVLAAELQGWPAVVATLILLQIGAQSQPQHSWPLTVQLHYSLIKTCQALSLCFLLGWAQ